MSKEELVLWEQQTKALRLSFIAISLRGFDPDTLVFGEVVRGEKTVTLDHNVYDNITFVNDGYRFNQFSLDVDTTLGELAKTIDIILDANDDERSSFLELVEFSDMDPVTGTIFYRVWIGS